MEFLSNDTATVSFRLGSLAAQNPDRWHRGVIGPLLAPAFRELVRMMNDKSATPAFAPYFPADGLLLPRDLLQLCPRLPRLL